MNSNLLSDQHHLHLTLTSHRLASEIDRKPGAGPECILALNIQANSFLTGQVEWGWERPTETAPIEVFHKFCLNVRGKPRQQWLAIPERPASAFFHDTAIRTVPQTEWLLLKAAILTYLWSEVAALNGDPAYLEKHLHDEFILDYTGQPGAQKHIYFLSGDLLAPKNAQCLNRLYTLCQLSRIEVQLGTTTFSNYFTPLIYPPQRIDNFGRDQATGTDCYALWRVIIARMSTKLRLFTEGRTSI